MAQSIVGLENVQPYKFSECSRSDYNSALRTGHGICLLNKPNEVSEFHFVNGYYYTTTTSTSTNDNNNKLIQTKIYIY